MKKNLLFVHQHYPGQFKHLAPALAKKYNVHSISLTDIKSEGVSHHQYVVKRPTGEDTLDLVKEFEAKALRGVACADKAYELKRSGFTPDLIIGHPGWGELLYLKEVWPESKMLSYLEYHYRPYDSDVDFDKEEMEGLDEIFLRRKLVGRNASFLSQYEDSDYFIAPTQFQRNSFPDRIKKQINVIHEGIDTDRFKPNRKLKVQIDEFNLFKEKKVILFVSRNLEPYRGYHIFMRSLPEIFKRHPDALVLIVGGEAVSYGKKAPDGKTWKNIFFDEVKNSIDTKRVKYLGYLPDHKNLTALMQSAALQVYLTYPFVLSWSMLESLACELLVIGSDTGPVKEVITDKKNGLLVDFFDVKAISDSVNKVLSSPEKYIDLAKQGRKTIIKNYDLNKVCLPKSIELVEKILETKNED
tara:strand:+ start:3620 stop:4858 length:1239 start_codon:yes stop_codon:yes gene_type:complete